MKKIFNTFLILSLILLGTSCEDVTDVNENPNGVDPSTAHPNLLISTVMTGVGKDLASKGYAGTTGASVQYIQKDSWNDNNYRWEGSGWSTYYSLLRTNKLANERAVELGLEFHEGVTLVLRAMLFGTLTDFYGDVPYSEALKGDEGSDFFLPKYDSQEAVYKGVISDLRAAAVLLSKNAVDYKDINPIQDVYFQGDPDKWMRFANSLALRYYMRLSEKLPTFAADGVSEMIQLPLIQSVSEECAMPFIGADGSDSWPNTGQTGTPSDYWRIKPCTTLTDKLMNLNDPRIDTWFEPVDVPIKVVPASEIPGGGEDVVVDGVRYIDESTLVARNFKIYNPATFKQDRLDGLVLIDTNSVYVGLPITVDSTDPFEYNLNPSPERGGQNVHVSKMNAIFDEKSGPNLKARIFSAAEVHFLMAEAAIRGWGSNAEAHYNAGIQASLEAWGIGDKYSDYIDNPGVAFDGTLEMIMSQKWIANFTNANEAYFDWRRLGMPALDAGPFAKQDKIPIRFLYDQQDSQINSDNYFQALNSLEETEYSNFDGVDSTWSRPWLLQGVAEPW